MNKETIDVLWYATGFIVITMIIILLLVVGGII